MQKESLNIPNISCGHCVAAVEKKLKLFAETAEKKIELPCSNRNKWM